MMESGLRGNVIKEVFMVHALNNSPDEDNVILDSLENCLTSSGSDVLMLKMICKILNHQYKN